MEVLQYYEVAADFAPMMCSNSRCSLHKLQTNANHLTAIFCCFCCMRHVLLQFWGCSDIYIGDDAAKKPHINSSWDQLSERLRSAMELQDRTGKPQHPVLPNKADYWRAELLAANELLDQTYHHGPHAEQPAVPQPVVPQPTQPVLPPGSVVSGVGGEQTSQVEGEATGVVEVSSGTAAESVAALGAEEGANP